ncbi:hypothetical protein [Arthrobacter sp. Z4-13]
MKTKTTKSGLPRAEQPTGLERARFHDGMVVKAEDLETAGQYPVSLLQSVLRSYLGCGVVCGLELGQKAPREGKPPWIVTVGRGLALDCAGFPIELTCLIELDFTPDPCVCEPPSDPVYIVIRHMTSDEATSDPCGCVHEPADKECDRLRDRALVGVFTQAELEEMSGDVCRLEKAPGQKANSDAKNDGEGKDTAYESDKKQADASLTDRCAALKDCCPSCSSGRNWVLLGTVIIDKEKGVTNLDTMYRRWVKPIEILCEVDHLAKRIRDLEASVKELQPKNEDSGKPSEQDVSNGVITPNAGP